MATRRMEDMAKWSGYQRFCSLSRGLDLIGERWTLLIVQEISFGPVRYNDLKRGLPGIGSNILADRLRKLEEHEVARRVPSAVGQGVRYELTDRGRGLLPAIIELRKWGLDEQLMLQAPAEVVVHDLSYGIPPEVELAETFEWHVDDAVSTLIIEGTTLTQRPGPAVEPSVTVKTTRAWMEKLVSGQTDWVEGRRTGQVEAVGSESAWQRMLVATAQPGADLSQIADDDRETG